jgi:hypothetical protein
MRAQHSSEGAYTTNISIGKYKSDQSLLKVLLIAISSPNQWRIQRFNKTEKKGGTPEGGHSRNCKKFSHFGCQIWSRGLSKSATANASMFNVSSILSVYQRCCQLDEKDAILQSYLFAFEEYRVFFFFFFFFFL